MEGVIALMIPIVALLIPIVAIMSSHQQKMAMMFRTNAASDGELQQLRMEIQELKSLVHQQALMMDNINVALQARNKVPPAPLVQERV